MAITRQLEPLFTPHVRLRGEDYFRERRVQVLTGSPTKLVARVRGETLYRSEIDLGKSDSIGLLCTCPYFSDVGNCKHLWACALAADEYGYLTGISGAGRVHWLVDKAPAAQVEKPKPPQAPSWRKHLDAIGRPHLPAMVPSADKWPPGRRIVYIVAASSNDPEAGLGVELAAQERKQNGDWSALKTPRLNTTQIASLPDAADREILSILAGSDPYSYSYHSYGRELARWSLMPLLAARLVPQMAATGRCVLRTRVGGQTEPLAWDDAGPWRIRLDMRRHGAERWLVSGALERDGERLEPSEAGLLFCAGLVFTGGRVAPLEEGTPVEWLGWLRRGERIEASDEERDELLRALLTKPHTPRVSVPDELAYEEVRVPPRPALRVTSDRVASYPGRLRAELWFDYDGQSVPATEQSNGAFDPAKRRFIARDLSAEAEAAAVLADTGVRRPAPAYNDPEPDYEISPSKLPKVVRELIHKNWRIEADGKAFRRPGAFQMGVSSGIDWFDLEATVQYGETSAKLPALLAALRRGDYMVRLDDGTYGLLPEEWLKRFAPFAGMGEEEGGSIRFGRNQAGLLDALLAAAPEATFDEEFARVREHLRSFEGVRAAPQPDGFSGELRGYQREGLGWLHFLRDFGFGGCLADDMGVGKTAQVLALLETRRAQRTEGEPATSLVVVPRSLIFNWKQEAARFTPALTILDHTGIGRDTRRFEDCDIVLTTYGTMRRDIVKLRDFEFDYVVLDEAQAIKNASSESAKAARLLRAQHRVAMSGTPVENHLGELWSLFEFLNPGMLGSASVFRVAGGFRNPDEETRHLLARAVRPFILRRTKQQVAPELPEKTEQTIYCELEAPQRKLYDELRAHYRNSLLGRIGKEGLAKSKFQVLEALLRLRQAACHPGLIDAKRAKDPSAKLDTLVEQLAEVIEEGHKALVFSQFTSLLALLRERLDGQGIVYEYLDGATTDRQARVERFQNDDACPLFLISLKAGGLGLNLTAAEYVFLLDPWWNPAVEAQAVDRAHRIGQTRQVFAYRLIARDTVEEKVLELQRSKRELADAVIGEDNSLIRDLKREDLELLLS